MNSERLNMKGMLYEEERKARRLDSQCKGSILLVRQLLNPYEDDICNLDIESAKAAMDTLCKDADELKAAKEKIKRLKDDLG